MAGVNNLSLNNLSALLGKQTPAAAPASAPAPAAPALASDRLALGGAGGAERVDALRQLIASGKAVDAAMAISQLEALAGSQRSRVIDVLVEQMQSHSDPLTRAAAISALQRMGAREAQFLIEPLINDPSPALAATARTAVQSFSAPAAAPTAQAAGTMGVASVPTGPAAAAPTAAAPAAAAPVALGADAQELIRQFNLDQTAPMAAFALSKLPPDQMVATARKLLESGDLSPKGYDLVVAVLSKHLDAPGALDALRGILRQDNYYHPNASGRVALLLLKQHNPAYLPDVLRVVASMDEQLIPYKRAIIDTLAQDPQALAHPATVPVLAAVLGGAENRDLSKAASHALGLIRSAAARDALVNSPLLSYADTQCKMRALWDLEKQPAPYPPAAVERLKRLAAEDADPQVRQLAKRLSERKK